MADRTIDSLPAESEFSIKKSMPIKITLEEDGVDVYHAEIDVVNPNVGGIHTYGDTEDVAYQAMVEAIQVQYKRHLGYSQAEKKGRVLAKLNNLNRYMEVK